jgi:drug/metabolite transporter (DMT)-like permease
MNERKEINNSTTLLLNCSIVFYKCKCKPTLHFPFRNFNNSMKKWSNQVKGTVYCVTGILALTPDSLLVRLVSRLPNFEVIFLKNIIQAVFLSLVLLITQGSGVVKSVKDLGRIGWIAGFIWAVSNFCITYAFQNTAVANVLVILAANPMFSAIATYFLLKETIRIRTMIAALVCFAAIIIIFSGELGKGDSSAADIVGLINALAASVTFGFYLALVRYAEMKNG